MTFQLVLQCLNQMRHRSQCHLSATVYRNKRGQCTCNVTLRRVHATIIAVEKQYVLCVCVCVCSLRYPARNAHAPYCHLWRTERDMIKNVYWCSCKVTVILVRFQLILIFRHRVSKNTHISNFMKIRPVGTEFYADGRTDT